MKSYCRKAITASVLVLTLSAPALAGEMQTGKSDPLPAANGVMQTGATEAETQTGEAASNSEATNTVAETALNFLQSLLTLF